MALHAVGCRAQAALPGHTAPETVDVQHRAAAGKYNGLAREALHGCAAVPGCVAVHYSAGDHNPRHGSSANLAPALAPHRVHQPQRQLPAQLEQAAQGTHAGKVPLAILRIRTGRQQAPTSPPPSQSPRWSGSPPFCIQWGSPSTGCGGCGSCAASARVRPRPSGT